MVGSSTRTSGRPEIPRGDVSKGPPDNVSLRHLVTNIEITNEQCRVPVDERRLRAAIAAVVGADARRGAISLAVVDDATIHALNRRYLDHDYPTDVLSFALGDDPQSLDGEIIVSADAATATAERYGWSAEDELLLYVIHGALHLVGFDDKSPADVATMREQEALHLASFGLRPRWQETSVGARQSRAMRPQLLGEGSQP
jgi:probable rRNA maturation factor